MPGAAIYNKVLLSLSKAALDKVLPECKAVSLSAGEVLLKAGDRADSVLFPDSGLVSVIAASSSGSNIEVGAVGKEGMLPVEALSGTQYSAHRYVVQIPGEAHKISAAALNNHFSDDLNFCRSALKFLQQLHNQATQLVLCNRSHTVRQRLCRWLLVTSDWVEDDRFPLTHEFLSLMLGVNRSTITLELGDLKSNGLISYRQRLIEISDKRRIATMACECYWTHKRDMDSYTKALQAYGASGTLSTRHAKTRVPRSFRSTCTEF